MSVNPVGDGLPAFFSFVSRCRRPCVWRYMRYIGEEKTLRFYWKLCGSHPACWLLGRRCGFVGQKSRCSFVLLYLMFVLVRCFFSPFYLPFAIWEHIRIDHTAMLPRHPDPCFICASLLCALLSTFPFIYFFARFYFLSSCNLHCYL